MKKPAKHLCRIKFLSCQLFFYCILKSLDITHFNRRTFLHLNILLFVFFFGKMSLITMQFMKLSSMFPFVMIQLRWIVIFCWVMAWIRHKCNSGERCHRLRSKLVKTAFAALQISIFHLLHILIFLNLAMFTSKFV